MGELVLTIDREECEAYDIIVFAHFADGKYAGCLMICTPGDEIIIRMIQVTPENRQRGVATVLLRYLVKEFGNKRIVALVIW